MVVWKLLVCTGLQASYIETDSLEESYYNQIKLAVMNVLYSGLDKRDGMIVLSDDSSDGGDASDGDGDEEVTKEKEFWNNIEGEWKRKRELKARGESAGKPNNKRKRVRQIGYLRTDTSTRFLSNLWVYPAR